MGSTTNRKVSQVHGDIEMKTDGLTSGLLFGAIIAIAWYLFVYGLVLLKNILLGNPVNELFLLLYCIAAFVSVAHVVSYRRNQWSHRQ
jgi:hypothetical protein